MSGTYSGDALPDRGSSLGPAGICRRFRKAQAVLIALLIGLVGLGAAANAAALLISIDTSALAGMSATLDFSFFDGDGIADNTVTVSGIATSGTLQTADCFIGCTGGPPYVLDDSVGFGQFLQNLVLGSVVTFDLTFTTNDSGSSVPDLLVVNLLDQGTSFTLVDTDLDALAAPIPYQDALLLVSLTGAGNVQPATATNPPVVVAAGVPEPTSIALLALGLALLACRRMGRPHSARGAGQCLPKEQRAMNKPLSTMGRWTISGLAVLLVGLGAVPLASGGHREAPLTAIDPSANVVDWFAFVSYDTPAKVTMILTVNPFLHPSNGPNYFPFDHEVLYEMKIDNTFDANEDIRIQFRFNKPEIRLPGVYTGFLGAAGGVNAPANSPPPVAPGTPLIPPAIVSLDGAGSEGLSLRQTYTVTIQKTLAGVWTTVFDSGPRKLIAVPSNAGPRTMPSYEALARQGIYDLGGGIKVFAGTVDDPFYGDLGGEFDSLNFRSGASAIGVPGVLSDSQDSQDTLNFAADAISGFNVNAIAIELPTAMLTRDGNLHAATDPLATIGTYATASRPRIKTQPTVPGGSPALSTNFTQINRVGNALVNDLIIGTGDKNKFSMSLPMNDGQFASYMLDPLLARLFNAAYGGAVPIPTPPRLDLLPLVTYAPPVAAAGTPSGPIADLLRLNTGVPATPRADRKRMGMLAGDPAGYPNGRRVSDDATDISLRAVVGVLAGPPFSGFPNNRIGDGVNANDRPYQETFPYVAFSNDGRNSRHVDPGEPGCAAVTIPFLPTNCPTN